MRNLLPVFFIVPVLSLWGQMDNQWATKAAGGGMAEVKLGQLAQDHASSQAVKDFARRMIEDHTNANNQLQQIAGGKGITLPGDMDAKDRETYNHLASLNGPAFDRAYMEDMVKDHREDIAEFKREASSGSDPALKHFAAMTLPTLEQHLQLAESTLSQLH